MSESERGKMNKELEVREKGTEKRKRDRQTDRKFTCACERVREKVKEERLIESEICVSDRDREERKGE